MARPIKNNADYFPHDADMRNDPRVKAIRRLFKLEGYAIYCMLIEYLTDAEYFEIRVDKLGLELMSGDFDCTTELLKSVLDYAEQLDLIQVDNSILKCKSLDNRMSALLSKRERDRDRVFDNDNTQSKVKESKVEKSKLNESTEKHPEFDDFFLKAFDEATCESYAFAFRGVDLGAELQKFRIKCDNDKGKYYGRDVGGLRTAFQYQLQNIRSNGKRKSGTLKDGADQIDQILARERNNP